MPKYRLRQVHQITMLYIFWILHQTTTGRGEGAQKGCCISFDSYIKPQHPILCLETSSVVYLLIPTSNHNYRCITLNAALVVYLLIPTSNHNRSDDWFAFVPLYIFWFLHQTTTLGIGSFGGSMLYIFWILHQTTTCGNDYIYLCQLYIFWILHQTTTLSA